MKEIKDVVLKLTHHETHSDIMRPIQSINCVKYNH